MSAALLEKIRKEAERLTSEERSQLMEYLLIDAQQEPVEISPAWIAEIERRAADRESGRDPGVPWEEVRKNMRDILKQR
jgi:putative addiction module component (TIGR02574 family)